MTAASQAAQSISLSEGLKHAHELEQEASELMEKIHSDVDASQKALRQSRRILRNHDNSSRA